MQAVYGPPSTEQALGALPVAAGFCRRLDIAGIIDRAAPVRHIARATHGQVIEALIANRLTSPSPMVHVGAWARQFAVGHVLGLAPDVLNDDRIARALDALAPVLEQVTGSVGAAAISRLRHRGVPAALGHDLGQPARGIRAPRRGLRAAEVRPPQGPARRPEADPGRRGRRRRRRGPGVLPAL